MVNLPGISCQVVELHMATSHHDAALQAAAKRLEVAQRNKASIKAQATSGRQFGAGFGVGWFSGWWFTLW